MEKTQIKLCGMTRMCDIEAVNALLPEYIGFVFWKKSKRYIEPEKAMELKKALDPSVKAVGVFIDEDIETVIHLLKNHTIDLAQLHGTEDEAYIRRVQEESGKCVIRAYRIKDASDIEEAKRCTADFLLLDSGAGTGKTFDWSFLSGMDKPYFLAGGLGCDNLLEVLTKIHPLAVDVSSGIETDGLKDKDKMTRFVKTVREYNNSLSE